MCWRITFQSQHPFATGCQMVGGSAAHSSQPNHDYVKCFGHVAPRLPVSTFASAHNNEESPHRADSLDESRQPIRLMTADHFCHCLAKFQPARFTRVEHMPARIFTYRYACCIRTHKRHLIHSKNRTHERAGKIIPAMC